MTGTYPMTLEFGSLFASNDFCREESRASGIRATATPEQSSQTETRTEL